MKYYLNESKLRKRKERKAILEGLTALEKTILNRARGGSDLMAIIGVCKPYTNKWGGREFASRDEIRGAVDRLCKVELLIRR